jgi:hypothetical protein
MGSSLRVVSVPSGWEARRAGGAALARVGQVLAEGAQPDDGAAQFTSLEMID